MILPRITLLCYLSEPSCYAQLVAQLLPHRVQNDSFEPDSALQKLCEEFAATKKQLAAEVGEHAVWSVLICRAVEREQTSRLCSAESTVEDFMHGLESWSIELQRHC